MTSLEDIAHPDKFLESIGMLRPFPATDLFQTMLGCGSTYSIPMETSPVTISVEDMEILNVNSYDHDMLLAGLDSSSIMEMHGDEFTQLLEPSEKWNGPAEPEFSTWNPSNDLLRFPLQKDVEAGSSDTHSGSTRKASQFTSVWTGTQGLKRSHSTNCVSKISDSSDNSDALEDDGGDKHGLDGTNSVSKNLVSERRRRKKLNERLYSLRALVPKISKMDKASIVSDAISYVQDLQKQVEVMQADIHALESSKESCHENSNNKMTPRNVLRKKTFREHRILELEVSQMEEQTYHLRIHCKKGPGVLVQLTRALEALDFEIINANLTSVNDHVLNTIVVKVTNGEVMTPEELKRLTLDVVPRFGLVV